MDSIAEIVLDGEVQHRDAVAAQSGASGIGVCASGGEGAATKGIAAAMADYRIDGITEVILDGEVQDGDTVAAKGCAGGIGIRTGNGNSSAAKGVTAAVADYRIDGIAEIVLDGEVQHGDAIAAEGGAGGVSIGASDSEGVTAKGVVCTVADYGIEGIAEVVLDSKVQDGDAVATQGVAGGVGVSASGRESATAKGVADTMADYRMDSIAEIVLDGKVQHRDAVAAESRAGGVSIGAGGSEGAAGKGIAAAVADYRIDGVAEVVLDGEVQHCDAVAAESRAGGVGVCAGSGKGAAAKGVVCTVADYSIDGIAEIVLDGEVQHRDAVATESGAGSVSVGSSGGKGAVAKGVATAMADYRIDGISANWIDMDMHGEYTVGTGSRM